MSVEAMYQEIILDHYKLKHHSGLREPYQAQVAHVNPTCGDEVLLRVALDGDRQVIGALSRLWRSLRLRGIEGRSFVSLRQAAERAALLGIPQLGSLFTDGFARNFLDPIIVGLLACMVLALVLDLAILVASRAVTPWLWKQVPA